MSVNWKLVDLEECASTFDIARREPAWTIVSCRRQSSGRGRFNRAWFGEAGGLWASYNVPLDPDSPRNWGLLPLVAGAALIRALERWNIAGLRLRWPNDVLVGRAKLAGVLVEKTAADTASIGIGLNMFNDVASLAGKTQDPPTRLANLAIPCPSVPEMRALLGERLEETFGAFCADGLAGIAPTLEKAWGEPRLVEAMTDAGPERGLFEGVAEDGSPVLRRADGRRETVPGVRVLRLKELG